MLLDRTSISIGDIQKQKRPSFKKSPCTPSIVMELIQIVHSICFIFISDEFIQILNIHITITQFTIE